MHRGLPLVMFIELVDFSFSESGFGTSVNSTMLVGLHVVHSLILGSRSGSWMSSYIPLTSDIVSICNAVLEISKVLKYSFLLLKNFKT